MTPTKTRRELRSAYRVQREHATKPPKPERRSSYPADTNQLVGIWMGLPPGEAKEAARAELVRREWIAGIRFEADQYQ